MEAPPNVVVAFSFTPEEVQASVEHLTPSVDRRIRAMKTLQERGWRLGLRFDPLIYDEGFREQYRRLYEQVFGAVRVESLHSVSLGPFRLPGELFRAMAGSTRRARCSPLPSTRRAARWATGGTWRRRWWGSAARSCCATFRRRSSSRA